MMTILCQSYLCLITTLDNALFATTLFAETRADDFDKRSGCF
jgi:hypothetical protein